MMSGRSAARTITVEGLRVVAGIGVLAHELAAPQPLEITLSVQIDGAPLLPARDEIAQVLDYRQLREIAKVEAERAHTHLLETLSGRIAERLIALPGVASARVRVLKPHVFDDCDGVAVEVVVQRGTKEGP